MTEEEARTKWCCNLKDETCCTDSCMAWRWDHIKMETCNCGTHNRSACENCARPSSGHCGLAGAI